MNIYAVSTGCYSDYMETVLSHNDKFTDEEFLSMCVEALEQISKTAEHNYMIGGEEASDYLVKKYGFKKVRYQNCYLFDYSYKGKLPEVRMEGDAE